jgi:A/G-specific adenine glycosylase
MRARSILVALALAPAAFACATTRGPDLEPRYVALHNAFAAMGLAQVGPLQQGSLAEGRETRLTLELGSQCTTLVTMGGQGVKDLDITLLDPAGKPIAHDTTREPQAVVRACVETAGTYTLLVQMKAGAGDFVAATWTGGVGSGNGVGAGAGANATAALQIGAGTCDSPIPVVAGTYNGSTARGDSENEGSCATSSSRELVYRLEVPTRQRVSIEVDPKFDAVLYLRKGECSDADSEVACNDDVAHGHSSKIDEVLEPGTYFAFVDGYQNEGGSYKMNVAMNDVPSLTEVCRQARNLPIGPPTNGSTSSAYDHAQASCGENAKGPDTIYKLEVTQRSRTRITLHSDDFAPVVHVRKVCTDEATEAGCADSSTVDEEATFTGLLDPAIYAVFADSSDHDADGRYQLTAELAPEQGTGTPGDGCGDAVPLPSTETSVSGDTFLGPLWRRGRGGRRLPGRARQTLSRHGDHERGRGQARLRDDEDLRRQEHRGRVRREPRSGPRPGGVFPRGRRRHARRDGQVRVRLPRARHRKPGGRLPCRAHDRRGADGHRDHGRRERQIQHVVCGPRGRAGLERSRLPDRSPGAGAHPPLARDGHVGRRARGSTDLPRRRGDDCRDRGGVQQRRRRHAPRQDRADARRGHLLRRGRRACLGQRRSVHARVQGRALSSKPTAVDPALVRRVLLAWYAANARDLPWRRTRDPYAIWLSEVMLQQTRVETVIPYYERFLTVYPTVLALAEAPLEEVLARWSGLGYYRRARALHAGAQKVKDDGGALPRTVEGLRAIDGIGPYTAGAIASIAFDAPAPLVDGNVARVLARLFALEDDVRSTRGAARVWTLAATLVPLRGAGAWNQALMELGATICAPRAPSCSSCPARRLCRARALGMEEVLPRLAPKKKPVPTPRTAVLATRGERVLLARRKPDGLFGGLWEPPSVDAEPTLDSRAALSALTGLAMRASVIAGTIEHVLSHRKMIVVVHRVAARGTPRLGSSADYDALELVPLDRIGARGISTLARKIIGLHGRGA